MPSSQRNTSNTCWAWNSTSVRFRHTNYSVRFRKRSVIFDLLGLCISSPPRSTQCGVYWEGTPKCNVNIAGCHYVMAGVLLRTHGNSVECEVVWVCSPWDSCKQQYWRPSNRPIPNRHVWNGHCTSVQNSMAWHSFHSCWDFSLKPMNVNLVVAVEEKVKPPPKSWGLILFTK